MECQPSLEDFVRELTSVPWYDLAIYLGIPYHELKRIEDNYETKSTARCLGEIHGYLGEKQRWVICVEGRCPCFGKHEQHSPC